MEIRTATVCHDPWPIQDTHHRPGLRAVGRITATRAIKGQQSRETGHFLLSQPLDPATFPTAVRTYWTIENSLHWGLDVTRGEDDLRNRRDKGPETLAPMRIRALNLARMTDGGAVMSMRAKRKKAA